MAMQKSRNRWGERRGEPALNLYIRLFFVFFKSFFRKKTGMLDESAVSFRVWPGDLDINLHMNNGRYLALMDLGRLDLIIRMGLLGALIRRRWRPMVGSEFIRFRRGLRPFQRFTLRTRIVTWDEKWVFIRQSFEVEGRAVALGVIKGLFRSPSGNVPSRWLVEAVSPGTAPPDPGDSTELWEKLEKAAPLLADSGTEEPNETDPPRPGAP
jgi:acyl-CoA thioesterase FadM